MNLQDKSNISNICRVCLERSSKLYPLEGPIINVDIPLFTMINYCTNTEVVLDDDLPSNVCLLCFRTVRIAYNFIKQFRETNKQLLEERENWKRKCKSEPEEIETVTLKEEQFEEEIKLKEESSNAATATSFEEENFESGEKIIITYVNDESNNSGGDKQENTIDPLEELSDDETNKDLSKMPQSHACPVCNKVFTNFKKLMIKHLQLNHGNSKFKCNRCFLDVELSADSFIEHYLYAHLYQCSICKKKLGSKSSFHYHVKSHTEDGLHCPYPKCKKSFPNQHSLKKHMNTHLNVTKYVCSKCGKNFNTYDTFRYHTKTHDGKRSYLCNVCGRAFLQSIHLKYHMWHHTGVKQFKCKDCDKSYTSVTQLKKHRNKYCGSTTKPSDKT